MPDGDALRAFKLKVSITDDHRLALDVPREFPTGPAEVIILSVGETESPDAFTRALDDLYAHRWTPPPGAPDTLTLLREDRDR